MNFGLYSYLGAAIACGFFSILLLFSWRSSLQGKLLAVVIMISTVWAALAAKGTTDGAGLSIAYQVMEILRYIAWYIFLLKLFDLALIQSSGYQKFVRWALPLSVGFAVLLLAAEVVLVWGQPVLTLTGHVFLALIGLAIIEQLYRNSSARHRWAIKYLFIGTGGIFVFDFYLYADALLFRGIDQSLWETRGIVNLVAVPLLAVSAARNKNWSLNIFVSRDIVLNTTAIVGGGIYLLVMAGAGYYLREYGGSWGKIGQVVFFSLAIVLLAVVLFSSQLRAKARVFLAKHFYKNKYDYRHEWLALTEGLSNKAQGEKRFNEVIEALAQAVDARAGMLWLRDEQAGYKNVTSWNTKQIDIEATTDEPLIGFLENTRYVINLMEIEVRADEYEGLILPEWLATVSRPWLVIPLQGDDALTGFVILANPLVVRSINWEDRDLLKVAAKQVSSHLTVLMTSDALAEAKQFEVFTRLSAYMVHDLKNIAAELELITINAKKHINNPEFVKDAFATVENAAGDINRLLEQLRNRRTQHEKKVLLDLAELVTDVIASKQIQLPLPQFQARSESGLVSLEKGRLSNVLAHLIDNAQQATEDEGEIIITLSSTENMHAIEIKDNGFGMDEDFIRNRLFKPFDTTKGNAGMGIGMYESREFIRQLGGDIYVQSKPGKGSIITLHIPLGSSHGAA